MTVLPAHMFVDSDLNGKAKLALGDLGPIVFASLDLAAGAIVGTNFYRLISLVWLEGE